jgi:hypothetical protein
MHSVSPSATIGRVADIMLDTLERWCREEPNYADGWVAETSWTKYFSALLNERGYPTSHQQRYSNTGKETCDLVVQLDQNSSLWLEVKGAWLITRPFLHSDGRRIGGRRNPSYQKATYQN